MELRRLTAKKMFIGEITTGRFVPGDGTKSSYVLTKHGRRASRVKISGNVIDIYKSESSDYISFLIDDGTGVIRVKFFTNPNEFDIQYGDFVDVFGKVKNSDGEIWISGEIIRKVEDPNVEILRKLENTKILKEQIKKQKMVKNLLSQTSDVNELFVLLREQIPKKEIEGIVEAEEKFKEEENTIKNKVLSLISQLDFGDGADYSDLLKESGLPEEEFDKIVQELLESGQCFEPRPGKIKRVM